MKPTLGQRVRDWWGRAWPAAVCWSVGHQRTFVWRDARGRHKRCGRCGNVETEAA